MLFLLFSCVVLKVVVHCASTLKDEQRQQFVAISGGNDEKTRFETGCSGHDGPLALVGYALCPTFA